MLRFKVTGYRPYRQAWNKKIMCVCIEQINDMGCSKSKVDNIMCSVYFLLSVVGLKFCMVVIV